MTNFYYNIELEDELFKNPLYLTNFNDQDPLDRSGVVDNTDSFHITLYYYRTLVYKILEKGIRQTKLAMGHF